MPIFALQAIDVPDGAALRKQLLDVHMEHVKAQPVDVKLAGPLIGEDGAPTGSLILFEAADLAAAHQFVTTDPYCANGIYAQFTIHQWKDVFKKLG